MKLIVEGGIPSPGGHALTVQVSDHVYIAGYEGGSLEYFFGHITKNDGTTVTAGGNYKGTAAVMQLTVDPAGQTVGWTIKSLADDSVLETMSPTKLERGAVSQRP